MKKQFEELNDICDLSNGLIEITPRPLESFAFYRIRTQKSNDPIECQVELLSTASRESTPTSLRVPVAALKICIVIKFGQILLHQVSNLFYFAHFH